MTLQSSVQPGQCCVCMRVCVCVNHSRHLWPWLSFITMTKQRAPAEGREVITMGASRRGKHATGYALPERGDSFRANQTGRLQTEGRSGSSVWEDQSCLLAHPQKEPSVHLKDLESDILTSDSISEKSQRVKPLNGLWDVDVLCVAGVSMRTVRVIRRCTFRSVSLKTFTSLRWFATLSAQGHLAIVVF